MVTVAMTPNGYADAPMGDRFVLPHEEQMRMREFVDVLNSSSLSSSGGDVVYIQKQNSSFTEEFEELIPDAGNVYKHTKAQFCDFLSKNLSIT